MISNKNRNENRNNNENGDGKDIRNENKTYIDDQINKNGNLKRSYFYLLTSIIFFLLLMLISMLFIQNFNINPESDITINLFLFDIFIFIIFVINFEQLLTKYENRFSNIYEPKVKNKTKKNIILIFLNKFFGILENFPYVKSRKRAKKYLIEILGWLFIAFVFSFSTYFRVAIIEFSSYPINNTFRQWTIYFGFYIFAFSTGAFIIFLMSKGEPYKIFKLSVFGVSLMIQIPATFDYLLIKLGILPSDTLPYGYIHWEDFLKAFYTMLLHPDLKYAVGYGYTVMILFLITFTCLYISLKRIELIKIPKFKYNFLFISIRTTLNAILMYSQVMFSAISAFLVQLIIYNRINPDLNLLYYSINNLYILPLFLYLIFLVFYNFFNKNKKLHTKNMNITPVQFELSNDRRSKKNEKIIGFKSKTFELLLKLSFIITGIIIFEFYNYYIIYLIPYK